MTKRTIKAMTKFGKDLKRARRQGKNIGLLDKVIVMLANDEQLPVSYRDHALKGNWRGYRECHVEPDWLLVYKKTDEGELLLYLARIASHSDLNF